MEIFGIKSFGLWIKVDIFCRLEKVRMKQTNDHKKSIEVVKRTAKSSADNKNLI